MFCSARASSGGTSSSAARTCGELVLVHQRTMSASSALGVQAVLGLVPHGRLWSVKDVLGDLLAVVGGEAVEDDRAVAGLLHEVGGDAVALEVAKALLALGVLAHARPDVRVEDVGAADRFARIA